MDGNGNQEATPNLSPGYKPATEDSVIFIRFVGNTAVLAGVQFKAIDAFQILAVAEFLKMKGHQTLAMQESAEAERLARSRIATPDSGHFLDPNSLRGG